MRYSKRIFKLLRALERSPTEFESNDPDALVAWLNDEPFYKPGMVVIYPNNGTQVPPYAIIR